MQHAECPFCSSLSYEQIFPSVFDFSPHYDILKTFILRAILLFFLCHLQLASFLHCSCQSQGTAVSEGGQQPLGKGSLCKIFLWKLQLAVSLCQKRDLLCRQ